MLDVTETRPRSASASDRDDTAPFLRTLARAIDFAMIRVDPPDCLAPRSGYHALGASPCGRLPSSLRGLADTLAGGVATGTRPGRPAAQPGRAARAAAWRRSARPGRDRAPAPLVALRPPARPNCASWAADEAVRTRVASCPAGEPFASVEACVRSGRSPRPPAFALATCSRAPELGEDGPAMLDALAARGLEATPQIWDDARDSTGRLRPRRGPLDLGLHRKARRVPRLGAAGPRLANPYAVIEWNSDKTYLRDLWAAGIPIGPDDSGARPGSAVVRRPTRSSSNPPSGRSRGDVRPLRARGPGGTAIAHVERLRDGGLTAMVQPYLAVVESRRRGLVYLGGRTATRSTSPPARRTRAYVEGTLTWESSAPRRPPPLSGRSPRTVLAVTPGGRENLLYARVDPPRRPTATPVLIELEATEPALYFGCGPGSPEVFADAVEGLARAAPDPSRLRAAAHKLHGRGGTGLVGPPGSLGGPWRDTSTCSPSGSSSTTAPPGRTCSSAGSTGRLRRRALEGCNEMLVRHPSRRRRRPAPIVPRRRRRRHRDQLVRRRSRSCSPSTGSPSGPTSSPAPRPSSPARSPTATRRRTARASSPGPSGRARSSRRSARSPSPTLREPTRSSAAALLEGGVDLLLVETCYDLLPGQGGDRRRAAGRWRAHGREVPIQVQVTIELTGRMLPGTEIGAALCALEALRPDVIGLNCATGPVEMYEHLRHLSEHAPLPVSVPAQRRPARRSSTARCTTTSRPTRSPSTSRLRRPSSGCSVVGGCCGTTPEHLAPGRRDAARTSTPRAARPSSSRPSPRSTRRSPFDQERVVPGHRRAHERQRLEEVPRGDARRRLGHVRRAWPATRSRRARTCSTSASTTSAPTASPTWTRSRAASRRSRRSRSCIDSTEPPVARGRPRSWLGGTGHPQLGEPRGRRRPGHAARPRSCARRASTARRSSAPASTRRARPAPPTGRCASRTRDPRPRRRALRPRARGPLLRRRSPSRCRPAWTRRRRDGIETIEAIRAHQGRAARRAHDARPVERLLRPQAPPPASVLNSVFLHECVAGGLDAAIVHAGKILPLHRIADEQREVCLDLIYDRRRERLRPARPRCIDAVRGRRRAAARRRAEDRSRLARRPAPAASASSTATATGSSRDLDEALADGAAPLDIVNDMLLAGMRTVGELFGSRRDAAAVRAAVGRDDEGGRRLPRAAHGTRRVRAGKGAIVLATVKGDVHDIGKNLVDIILTNNGYEVAQPRHQGADQRDDRRRPTRSRPTPSA